MRHRALLPLVLLTGCMLHSRGVRAAPDALSCAGQTLASLGYHILSPPERIATGSFTAEREMPRAGIHRVVGEMTVAVWGESGERRLAVEGRRFEEVVTRVRSPGNGAPAVGVAQGQPQPIALRVGSSRVGRRNLPAGPVADDVEAVRSRCGEPIARVAAAGD